MSAKRIRAALCALLAVMAGVLVLAAPAHSEKGDREKPIHLEADRVTVDDAKQLATFTGNVVLTQGTMVMRGDRMEVRQDKQGFRQGTIWGKLAYFRQKREGYADLIEGWAERIEYDGRTDKVQMYNRAMLKRGQDEARGNYISYDITSEFFEVDGATKSASSKPGDTRVRVILQPKPREEAAPAPAVPLKQDASGATLGRDADGGRK